MHFSKVFVVVRGEHVDDVFDCGIPASHADRVERVDPIELEAAEANVLEAISVEPPP